MAHIALELSYSTIDLLLYPRARLSERNQTVYPQRPSAEGLLFPERKKKAEMTRFIAAQGT